MQQTLQTKATQKAISWLTAMNVEFHIKTADGTEYGAPIGQKERQRAHRRGPSNQAYFDQMLTGLPAGDSKFVAPQAGDTLERCARNASAWCSKRWGNGTYMTTTHQEQGIVEVLRLA